MPDCTVTWPLLDPNEEDAAAGHGHGCESPHFEEAVLSVNMHTCGCGDSVVEYGGVLYRACDGCSDLVPTDRAHCDTCVAVFRLPP